MYWPARRAAPTDGARGADKSATDRAWLRRAVELSHRCAPISTAYNVGAVIVRDDVVIAEGYSRDTDSTVHAEESAFAKLTTVPGVDLRGACIYTSMEPCTTRASRPLSCTQLILDAGIRRVVLALREPRVFVACQGVGRLTAAGVEVVELSGLTDEVIAANAHVLRDELP